MSERAGRNWPGPRTQFVWWFPEWCGLGLYRWEGTSAWMFRWSPLFGFVELRRWRAWNESWRLFRKENDDAAKVADFGAAVSEPSRNDQVVWALQTVNSMVSLGIIENTVEARGRHLDAILDVLLGPAQQQAGGDRR